MEDAFKKMLLRKMILRISKKNMEYVRYFFSQPATIKDGWSACHVSFLALALVGRRRGAVLCLSNEP